MSLYPDEYAVSVSVSVAECQIPYGELSGPRHPIQAGKNIFLHAMFHGMLVKSTTCIKTVRVSKNISQTRDYMGDLYVSVQLRGPAAYLLISLLMQLFHVRSKAP